MGQGDSSAEEEHESEMEEERDACLDEEKRETMLAVMRRQAEHTFLDERRQRMDMVIRCNDKWEHIEEEVPAVSTSASNQRKWTIKKEVAFSKQLAKVDAIPNTTANTPKAPNVTCKKTHALDTSYYEVLGGSQLEYIS